MRSCTTIFSRRLTRAWLSLGRFCTTSASCASCELGPAGAEYTAAGSLIGHVLQGRDMVREAAGGRSIDPDPLLRLEHVIVSHQRLPEWGAPKPPMTPEALIVHYADDLDAKLQMVVAAIEEDPTGGPMTSKRERR